MRIAFFDHPEVRPPLVRQNRFAILCEEMQNAGHDARLVDAPLRGDIAIVAGASRERDVAPLIAAASLVDVARDVQADVAVFPLRGGLAHGVLMARACGEWDRPLRVVLWGDAPSRVRFLDDWASNGSLAPIVADALERVCVELADALVVPDEARRDEIVALGAAPAHVSIALLSASGGAHGANAERLVFANVSGHRAEWLASADGGERLAAAGYLRGKDVVFAFVEGAASRDATEIMRLRAQRWSFPHRIVQVNTAGDLRVLRDRARTRILFAAHDAEDVPPAIGALSDVATVLLRGAAHDGGCAIEQAAFAPTQPASLDISGWTKVLIGSDRPMAQSHVAAPSLSVCILHHERPAMLDTAVKSVGDAAAEIIVLDNASRSAEARAALSELEHRGLRVIRFETPQSFAEVYNAGARAAQGDFVVFLDDDNLLAPGGLARVQRACATGALDVVTSNLDLFDDADESGTAARMAFIGPARTAGLFFNAFGDTCMAFRREAFLSLGGFREFAGPYPAADWLLLARAQAARLRIGVLQQPAFRYRRHDASAALAWQKADRAGARALVRDAYGDAYDAQLLAKCSQDFWLASE